MSLIISDIYNEFVNSRKNLNKLEIYEDIIFLNFLQKKTNDKSYYLPKQIQNNIDNFFNVKYSYKLVTNSRKVNLNFYVNDKDLSKKNI